jgi:DNA adenine methylase
MTTITRPALRYHGGKFRLAKWIISNFPAHRIYVEPFGGAASVLLQKPRCYAEIYNDLDGELVNLFCIMRDRGAELREKLFYTPFARDEFELSYEATDDQLEQARRTVVRSFMGFGSNAHNQKTGYRHGKRSNTTPATDWRGYPDALDAIIDRLRGVNIENRDAIEVMSVQDDPAALHYVDPPYVFSTRTDNGADYRHEMTDAQHVDLLQFLRTLRGAVVLSGYRCPMYDGMLHDWRRVDRVTVADQALERMESLWLSPNIQNGQSSIEW